MKRIFSLYCLCFFALTLSAQHTEIGFSAGAAFFRGELAGDQVFDFSNIKQPALGFQVRFSPFTRFSSRLGFMYAQLSSAEDNRAEIPGLQFQTKLYDAHLLVEWNLADADFGGNFGLTGYLFGGVGGFFYQPQAMYEGRLVDLQSLGTENQGNEGFGRKYSQLHPTIPLGLGVRFWLGDRLSLLLEGSSRFLFTDYLDDVGNTQVIYQEILENNGPIAAALSNPNIEPGSDEAFVPYRRGDARNDSYYFLNLTLTYRTDGGRMGIKVRKNCPVF